MTLYLSLSESAGSRSLDRLDNSEGLLCIPEPFSGNFELIPINQNKRRPSHAILHETAQTLLRN
jgi:hypothetical protein